MKQILMILLGVMLLFSGCIDQSANQSVSQSVDQSTVKIGDDVSVDYVGSFVDGEVFDTSIEAVASENDILNLARQYGPLNLTVGTGQVIPGFDKAIIGMTVGESKTVTIPPEDAYGIVKPELIDVMPVKEIVPEVIPRVIDVHLSQFNSTFGAGHKVGDLVTPPDTNFSFTILDISSTVKLSHNFDIGETLPSQIGLPWNSTVLKMDDTNVTLQSDAQVGEVVQYKSYPWNSTVIEVNDGNIILQHNPIPNQTIQTPYGAIKVKFDGDSIIIDRNGKFAGQTLVFELTLVSINK